MEVGLKIAHKKADRKATHSQSHDLGSVDEEADWFQSSLHKYSYILHGVASSAHSNVQDIITELGNNNKKYFKNVLSSFVNITSIAVC